MKLVETRGPLDRPKGTKELEDEDHSIVDAHGVRHGVGYVSNETHAVTLCGERIPLRYEKDQIEDAKLRLTWSCMACIANKGDDGTTATMAVTGNMTIATTRKIGPPGGWTMMAGLPTPAPLTIKPKGPR